MRLEFSSIEEVKEFYAQLKGKRGAKGGDDGEGATFANPAPAPIMPPAAAAQAGFMPQGAAGFPGAGIAPSFGGASPEVMALVNRISVKIDAVVAGGQPTDTVLKWFRERCGAEAATATLDQIKTVFLSKLPTSVLEETAKLIGA
jgi:hypothetical protein